MRFDPTTETMRMAVPGYRRVLPWFLVAIREGLAPVAIALV